MRSKFSIYSKFKLIEFYSIKNFEEINRKRKLAEVKIKLSGRKINKIFQKLEKSLLK